MKVPPVRLCPRHHVAIGPRGCPACQHAEALAHREERRAFWRWALWACVPLLAVGAWALLRPGRSPGPERLDPEPYRKAIETAESILYQGDRLKPADRATLAEALQALGEALHRTSPSVALRRAVEGMDRFLAMTAIETRDETFDVVRVRTEWEALREACFQDAKWFARASPELEEAQASTSARGVPPDVDRYEQSLRDVEFLADRAETYVGTLPELPRDVDEDTYSRWQSQAAEMAGDVEKVRAAFPLSRDDVDPGWRHALFNLENALRAVSRICGPGTTLPSRGEGQLRVGRARSAIRKARESIAAAPR